MEFLLDRLVPRVRTCSVPRIWRGLTFQRAKKRLGHAGEPVSRHDIIAQHPISFNDGPSPWA